MIFTGLRIGDLIFLELSRNRGKDFLFLLDNVKKVQLFSANDCWRSEKKHKMLHLTKNKVLVDWIYLFPDTKVVRDGKRLRVLKPAL